MAVGVGKRWSFCWAVLVSAVVLSVPVPANAADSFSVFVLQAPTPLLVSGSAATSGITTLTTHTEWNLPGWAPFSVTTCIYMTAPLIGTPGNSDSVPYDSVRATPTRTGVTSTMVNQNSCRATGALVIGTSRATSNNGANPETRGKNGYRDDSVNLQVVNIADLTPDTYTGTITISATWY